jgi:hypothetical protein
VSTTKKPNGHITIINPSPKNIRDEFAMMAWVAIFADKKHLYAVSEGMGATMEDAAAMLAYLYADAMMERREIE